MPLPDRGWSMSVKLETVSRIIGGVADSTDSVLGYLHRSPNILSWSLYGPSKLTGTSLLPDNSE